MEAGMNEIAFLLEPDELPDAEFSPCRTWRYVLRRRWGSGPPVGFILLNPSTADETRDDPTIRRCVGYAKGWGFGALTLGNLFALRSTDPRALRSAFDPIGPANDTSLLAICDETGGNIICGWGSHGSFMGRGAEVTKRLLEWGARPMALKLTGAGDPGHPLYLRADLKPFALSSPVLRTEGSAG
jgi:hypothetical protein